MLAISPATKLDNYERCRTFKKEKFTVMRSRSREKIKFGYFTLFADDGKEIYQNVKRTCRAIGFAH